MTIFRFPQHSPAWRHVRCGLPTASEFDRALSSRKDTRRRYRRELLDEWIYGPPSDQFVSDFMVRGWDLEGEALQWYMQDRLVEVEQVGFILHEDGYCGGSPDGLVGPDGILEVKTKERKGHIGAALRDNAKDHFYQCQGNMWLAGRGRKWCDLLFYVPPNPHSKSVTVRIERDDAYIEDIQSSLRAFSHDLQNEKMRLVGLGWTPWREFDAKDYDPTTGELLQRQRDAELFDAFVKAYRETT